MELQREQWKSKSGLILAVAGSAVGIGNFLRFPGLVAEHGGAFMIPYFISLLLLGLPLMWIEWTFGRYGGGFGHSTAPGVFHSMRQKNRFIKYFGVAGILGPLLTFVFYTYIVSWLLGYSFVSLFDMFKDAPAGEVLKGYMGTAETSHFPHGLSVTYTMFVLTFVICLSVLWKGISAGIEKLCQWAMPLLLLMAVVLMISIFTATPPKGNPTISQALGTMWNPDMSKLGEAKIWMDAAGQVFFSLSIGFGAILTYASYLKKEDDVALSGLTAATTNTMIEVVLGASIVIPAAYMFLGPQATQAYVSSGSSIGLGMIAMPQALAQMPFHNIFGFFWFFLLFLAGVTSAISMAQPAIAFLQDEFRITRNRSVVIFGFVTFGMCSLLIVWQDVGIDEFDFWAAKFIILVFGLIEIILAGWILGIDKIWKEMHLGSDIKIPRIYRYITKYVAPLGILAILGFWLFAEGGFAQIMLNPELTSDEKALKTINDILADPEKHHRIATIRFVILGVAIVLCGLIAWAWKRREAIDYPEFGEVREEQTNREDAS